MQKFGVQLYTIRDFMKTEDEVRESFAKLRAMGYEEAQTAGCAIPYDVFGKLACEAGLAICGTHDDWDMMVNDPEQSMENHRLLHTTNIGVGGGPGLDCIEGIQAYLKQVNKVAETFAKNGFKFTYHNHNREFIKYDGKTVMDYLIEGTDPATVSFVFDTYWAQYGGADVRAWIEKMAGRIDILHLKDMASSNNGPYYTEIGQGNLNWEGILALAEQTGVKHYVVEQDTCPGNPFDSLKISADYLKKFVK